MILRGPRASQPLATDVVPGTLYFVSDESVTERSTGTVWESYSGAGGGGGTGDVVGPASATDDAVALYDGTTGKLLAGFDAHDCVDCHRGHDRRDRRHRAGGPRDGDDRDAA